MRSARKLKKNPARKVPGSFSCDRFVSEAYSAVVLTQFVRWYVMLPIAALEVVTVEVPTVVEGYQGGANPPLPKRLSKKMFLDPRLAPLLACMAMRPPTMFSVPIVFHCAINPPEPPLEIMESEASISMVETLVVGWI